MMIHTEKRMKEHSEFYDKYAGALYGIILKIVGKEIIAEKVLEKVFIKNIEGNNNDAPKLLSDFTLISNQSRKKSNDSLKAIQIFQACNNGWNCLPNSKDKTPAPSYNK